MSYGKKLNELERQVERFGVDDDFCMELHTLACKLIEKYPIGNDELKKNLDRFQESKYSMFMKIVEKCRDRLGRRKD